MKQSLRGARQSLRLDLERLQWITLIAPPIFIIVLAVGSYLPHQYQLLGHEGEHVLMAAIMIAAALAFSPIACHVIRDAQRRPAEQNAELREAVADGDLVAARAAAEGVHDLQHDFSHSALEHMAAMHGEGTGMH